MIGQLVAHTSLTSPLIVSLAQLEVHCSEQTSVTGHSVQLVVVIFSQLLTVSLTQIVWLKQFLVIGTITTASSAAGCSTGRTEIAPPVKRLPILVKKFNPWPSGGMVSEPVREPRSKT